jgi:hypothetical protein
LFELAVPALVILCSGIFVDAGEGVCSRITCSVGDSCACCGSYSGVSWGVSNDWAAACSSGDSCTTIVSPPLALDMSHRERGYWAKAAAGPCTRLA